MKITLEKNFDAEGSVDKVWGYLIDPHEIVQCVPGVILKDQVNETTYKGDVALKFGPVTAKYNGEVTYEKIDPDNHNLILVGKGLDAKGKGSAEMELNILLEKSTDDATRVKTIMTVSIVGMLAQFGSRLINDVSDQLFNQFVKNFQNKLSGGEISESDKNIKGGKMMGSIVKGIFKK